MPMRDLHSNLNIVHTYTEVAGSTTTGDVNCSSVDHRGFESVEHVVICGNSGDTLSGSVYWDFELEESVDDSVWTDVQNDSDVLTGSNSSVAFVDTANGVFATIDAPAEDTRVLNVGYRGTARYTRVVINATGTHTNGTAIACCAIRSNPSEMPTSDDGI